MKPVNAKKALPDRPLKHPVMRQPVYGEQSWPEHFNTCVSEALIVRHFEKV